MKSRNIWPIIFLAVFALSRWPMAMPTNFSAAYAIAFCAGLYLPSGMAWIVPLAVLAGSDVLISWFFYHTADFSWKGFLVAQAPNYIAYAVLIGLGRSLGRRRSWVTLLSGGLLGAALFYLITNTASWLALSYTKDFAGWVRALTRGFDNYPSTWEFFRNTLMSGGLFTGLFVGAMKLTEPEAETEEEEEEPEAEAEQA